MDEDYGLDSYALYKLKKIVYGDNVRDDDIRNRLIKTPEDFEVYHSKFDVNNQNGATVVFTGKQYVFAKNSSDGQNGHIYCFAETYLAMMGDHSVISFNEANRIKAYRDKKYFRMTLEDEQYRKIPYRWVRAYIPEKSISPGELASFQAFYDQFADSITKHNFSFFVRNEELDQDVNVGNIDRLLEYLKFIVDEKKEAYVDPAGEQIVGCPNGYEEVKKLV